MNGRTGRPPPVPGMTYVPWYGKGGGARAYRLRIGRDERAARAEGIAVGIGSRQNLRIAGVETLPQLDHRVVEELLQYGVFAGLSVPGQTRLKCCSADTSALQDVNSSRRRGRDQLGKGIRARLGACAQPVFEGHQLGMELT